MSTSGKLSTFNFQLSTLFEKWPFFLLSTASCVITFLAQRGTAVSSLANIPLGFRLENSLTAYAGYLWKMVWPVDLAIFYPLRASIAGHLIAESAILLTGISIIIWREHKNSSVAGCWLALVFGHTPAGDWPDSGWRAGDGRSLQLFSSDRDFSSHRFFGADLDRTFWFLKKVVCGGGGFDSWRVCVTYGKTTALLA